MLLSIQNLEVRYGSNKALSITAPIELEEGDRVGVAPTARERPLW